MKDLNYEVFYRIKKYYNENCKPLIFIGEKKLTKNNKCKMYFCDVSLEKELENYKKVFQEYLALYVRSYDKLKYYNDLKEATSDDDISKCLYKYGYDIWNNTKLILTTTPKTLGIYGEAINDFYLNIVKNENILLTYSTKRGYGERNIKGIDVLASTWENDCLTIIFSECKFVESISKASGGLFDDIMGTEEERAHISSDYINDYITFVVDKMHSIFSNIKDSEKMMFVLDQLNNRVVNGEKAIDVFNDLNIKIRFDFFAIYNDNRFTPDQIEKMYDKVLDAFDEQVKLTGIKKYDMEIVYIPIKNTSVSIKENMIKWN